MKTAVNPAEHAFSKTMGHPCLDGSCFPGTQKQCGSVIEWANESGRFRIYQNAMVVSMDAAVGCAESVYSILMGRSCKAFHHYRGRRSRAYGSGFLK